ncbi:MAG: hypothetical protein ACM3SU_17810 [Acidobacteriota bacterium]
MTAAANTEGSSTRNAAVLTLVAILGLLLRIFFSRYHPLDHNGGWHLFIARNFRREYANLAHPPLFLLLLKGCDRVSHTLAAYRFFPVLASVGSIVLVGRILQKLGTLSPVAVLGALVFACAQTSILLSLEVESYTLCVFLMLASFLCYLDLVTADARPPKRSRILFSTFASLALLSHYFAGLYLVVCVAAPLVAATMRPEYRRALRSSLRRRWFADVLTLLFPFLVGLVLYLTLAKPWVRSLDNMPTYYFRPGEEPLSSFWIRNLRETFNLFAPFPVARARWALPPLLLFLAGVLWAPATEKSETGRSPDRLLPAVFLWLLLLGGMLLGAIGRYPFGGLMRQQFLLFVFALLAGCVAVDRLFRFAGGVGRILLVAICLAAVGADFKLGLRGTTTPDYAHEALVGRRGIYARHLAGRGTVHVDAFNLIGVMMDFYGWDWRFEGPDPAVPSVERYELTRGGKRLNLLVHRWIWIMDFQSPGLYAELSKSLGPRAACETVFCVDRNLYGPPWTKRPPKNRAALLASIPALAANVGVRVRRVEVTDDAIDVVLCETGSGPP